MGYRIEFTPAFPDWLDELRTESPPAARLVGEAVTALLIEGGDLGPPLVSASEWLVRAQGPSRALDRSYQRQLDLLQRVRRGVAEVSTSRKHVELQLEQLERQFRALLEQGRKADELGRSDLAQDVTDRRASLRETIAQTTADHRRLQRELERLTGMSGRLQLQVDRFRTRKEVVKAVYTAGQAEAEANRIFADHGMTDAPDPDTNTMIAAVRVEIDDMLSEARDVERQVEGDPGLAAIPAVPPPSHFPELKELRAEGPSGEEIRMLFTVERAGTAVLLAAERRQGDWWLWYDEVAPIAAELLARRQLQGASTTYSTRSFLKEFFPGRTKEIQAGAARLIARNHIHSLSEIRHRAGLTEAQLADRLHLPPERITEIEQADTGALDVATLASFVEALGGRLEIVAGLGSERIVVT